MSTTDLKSYRPGSWFGIFGERATVLLPASEKGRVAGLWELVDEGADFGEVLDALIAGGLRDLPGFVLVSDIDGTTQVVLRGPAKATFTTADGEIVEVDGSTASTWVERSLTGVQAMRVSLEDTDDEVAAEGADFAITGGLVRVGRVDEPPYAEAATEPVAEEPVAEEPAPVTSVASDETDLLEAVVLDAEVPASWSHEPVAWQPVAGEPIAEGPAAEAPVPPAEPAWGPGPEVAVPPPIPPIPPVPPAWGTPVPAPGVEAPGAPVDEPVWGEPAAEQPEAPIAAPVNPWGPSGPGAPPEPAEADADEDHDGMTRDGAWDANHFARQPPGIPGQPPAPSVTARPVARLAFSSGEIIDVDRAILVGRAPEARRFSSTDQPRLVTVPSPHQEISSTHLEIRPGSGVDHGSAIVTDMGSTNGTVLVQPGLAPEDLQPGIPVQLIPGAIVDLGDGVTISVTNP